jgi:predicted ATPase/class 3 adenylate cyclase
MQEQNRSFGSTFCLTDIVGSTALWDSEPDAMAIALADHDSLVARVVEGFGGQLIRSKGEGDSSFSVFESPLSAIAAAIELVSTFGSRSWPPGGLRLRVGIHSGEADTRDGDWFGPAVNRAARIRGLAENAGVLCSSATADLIRDHLRPGVHLIDVGEHSLMGLKVPERVWALSSPGVPVPRLTSSSQQPVIEPVKTSFVGRTDSLNEVLGLVREHRLVTLVGGAGTGKTRLAREVASRAPMPAGSLLIELADVRDPAAVSAAVFQAITVESGWPGEAPRRLADRAILLVMDNCEHVVDAAAGAVRDALDSTSHVHILATSRELLSLTNEVRFVVQPLGLPSARVTDPSVAMNSPAVRLFLDRAKAVHPDLVVAEFDIPVLVDIALLLDGVPLAIELAAGGLASSGLRDLARNLKNELPMLVDRRRDVETRHKSLQAALDWTYGRAPEDAQSLFRRLSVFARFRTDDAVAVAGAGRSDSTRASLHSLLSMSMVVMEDTHGEAAYRLLQPVRLYASARLQETPESEVVQDRHAEYIADTAAAAGKNYFVDQASVIARLRFVAADIELSLHRLFSSKHQYARAVDLMSALGLYWFFNDPTSGRRWVVRANTIAPELDERRQLALHFVSGLVHHGGPGISGAISELQLAVDGYARLGRKHAEASSRFWLGRALVLGGRPEKESMAMFQSARALAEAADDPLLGLWCRLWLVEPMPERPLAPEMVAQLEQIIDDAQAAGARHPIGHACALIGRLALEEGDFVKARRYCDEAVAIYRELDDPWQLATQLSNRAWTALGSNDLISAALDVVEDVEISLEIGEEMTLFRAANVLRGYALAARHEDRAELLATACYAYAERTDGGARMIRDFKILRPDRVAIAAALPLDQACRNALIDLFG